MHGNREYENPLGNLLAEVNDMEIGEGPSNFDMQPSGYDVEVGNLKDTPFLASQGGVLVVYFDVIFVVRVISRL